MKKSLISAAAAAAALLAVSCSSAQPDITGDWTVTEITGVELGGTFETPVISFDAQTGEYHGNSGVNSIFGNYSTEGNTITIDGGGMTKMMGDPASMEVERKYVEILNSAKSFEQVDENTVVLKAESGDQMTLKKN